MHNLKDSRTAFSTKGQSWLPSPSLLLIEPGNHAPPKKRDTTHPFAVPFPHKKDPDRARVQQSSPATMGEAEVVELQISVHEAMAVHFTRRHQDVVQHPAKQSANPVWMGALVENFPICPPQEGAQMPKPPIRTTK